MLHSSAARVITEHHEHSEGGGLHRSAASSRLKRAALTVLVAQKVRLHRKKLCERLLLEEKTKRGLRRLINQMLIAIFTVSALKAGGGSEDMKRGMALVYLTYTLTPKPFRNAGSRVHRALNLA